MKDKPMIADFSEATLYVFGETTTEVEFFYDQEPPDVEPFERVPNDS